MLHEGSVFFLVGEFGKLESIRSLPNDGRFRSLRGEARYTRLDSVMQQ